MSTNQTPNYQLSQWEAGDQILRADFNADNAKIDGALKTQADTLAAVQAQLPGKGTCSVGAFLYTGNGRYGEANPTLIHFRKKPTAFIIVGGSASVIGNESKAQCSREVSNGYTNVETINLTWSGSTLKLFDYSHAHYQMNEATVTYIVIAFYSES